MNRTFYIILIIVISNISYGQTVPSYVSTNGLLGWYPFNGNADNEFGTGRNGVVIGSTLTTDRFGNANSAYHFNGSTNHIDIDTAFFNVGWSNYSISCWLNSDSYTNPNAFANDQSYFNTVPHRGIDLGFNYSSNNKYTFFVNSDPSATQGWDILAYDTSTANISIHTWNHVVFVKKDDTSYQFYLNGELDKTYNWPYTTALNYYCKIIFGRIDTTHINQGFLGKLDDYGIWNRSLTACEIRRLYNSNAFSYITLQPANVTAAIGSTVHFSVTDTGTGNTHQWQMDNGSGFTNLSNATPYSGVTTSILTVAGVTTAMNNNKFRCVVSGAQTCIDTSGSAVLAINTSGVANINSNASISLAPNPTSDYIIVSGAGKTNIRVYNNVGQLVKEAGMAEKISIRDMPVGMYLVKLFNEQNGNLVFTGKVIKYE